MTVHDEPVNSALSKSPILYLIEEATPLAVFAIAEVYIWFGDVVTSKPGLATYKLRKVLDVNNRAIFNVSRLVKDFVSNSDPITYAAATLMPCEKEACWVSVNFGYAEADNTEYLNQASSGVVIATAGYGEFLEGVNVESPALMTDSTIQILNDDNKLLFAISNDTIKDFRWLEFRPDVGATVTYNTPGLINLSTNNVLFFDGSPGEFSGQFEKRYSLVLVSNSLSEIGRIDVTVTDVCKYEAFSVMFINRYGVWDTIPFSAKNILQTKAKTEQYKNSDLGLNESLTSLTYNDSLPQAQRYNTSFVRTRTLNTWFLDEGISKAFEQLLISEQTYIYELTLPVNPMAETLLHKTGLNDKLIQYTINFEEAFTAQNQIQ